MDKSLLATGIAVATAATTVPTVTSALGDSEPIVEVQQPPGRSRTPKWGVTRKMSTLSNSHAITKEYKNIDCLKDQFVVGEGWSNGSTIPNPKIDSINNDNSDLKSCLIIEYYKQSYKDNKWWGEFKLVWSLTGSNQGVVVSFHSKTNNGKMEIDANAYNLEKDNDNWKILHRQEPSSGYSSNVWSDKFPTLGSSLKSGSYLDFNPKSGSICKANECTDDNKEEPVQVSIIWEFEKGDGEPITNWNNDFHNWFEKVFDYDSWSKMKDEFQKLTGSWKIKN